MTKFPFFNQFFNQFSQKVKHVKCVRASPQVLSPFLHEHVCPVLDLTDVAIIKHFWSIDVQTDRHDDRQTTLTSLRRDTKSDLTKSVTVNQSDLSGANMVPFYQNVRPPLTKNYTYIYL